jgi:putative PEP-CTERM system histidine kinase
MLYLGIPFSRNLTIFIGFAGGILILTLLFSEQIRRRVRVFVNKHFYRSKHDYREEWLKFTERLACCSTIQAVHEAILTTYRDTFGLRGAALYIRGKTGAMRRVAHLGVCGEQREITVSEQLTSYFLEKGRILNAADGEYLLNADEDAFVRETEAGLIIPLAGQGRMEGLIVLCRQLVPEEFTYEDYDLMKTLAKQATLSLVNFSLSEELAETREISAIARISSFVIHDLKNQTATLSLLADNAEEHMDNPEFQSDFVKAVRNTLAKMLSLIQILRNSPEAPRLNLNPWDIDTLARDAVAEVGRLRPATSLEYRGVPVRAFVDGEEIRKVLFNLLINAVDAIGPEGQIRVEVEQEGKRVCLRVTDDGCGMTNDFMERQLFKPFRTTKKTGLGIGLYQCRQIVEAHGGTIEVASEQGKGSRFAVIML